MYQAGLCWGHHYRLTLAFCGDSWVFLSCLHPYINADWGAEKQREVQECGVQRLSGKYEDKGRIRESNISVDRGETQYWYLTPGEKASKIQKQRVVSEESVSTDYSHSTNGLLARLYTCILGPAFRFVRCLQQNYGVLTFWRESVCFPPWCRSKHHRIGLSLWALYLPHITQDHLHFNPPL